MAKSRSIVTLSAAVSIDGKIASVRGDSKLSSETDVKRIHQLRSKHDAILIGRRTAIADDPLLTVRHVRGKNPVRVIIDSHGTLSESLNVIKTADKIPTIVATSAKISKSHRQRLEGRGVRIIVAGKDRINVSVLLHKLWKIKIKTVLLEGGGKTNWEFVSRGLVDSAVITVSPYILGGQNAPTLVDGVGFHHIAKSADFTLKKWARHKNEMILSYSKL